MSYNIGIIVGSISSTSLNRKLANALTRLAPPNMTVVDIPIDELPFYKPDYDADYPMAGRKIKAAIEGVDGVIIVTPEYSRSIPGVLKNALDWAARPWGKSSFSQMPTATIGASTGVIGTAAGQQHLRSVLLNLGAIVMGQPEGYIHAPADLLSDEGEISNAGTEAFLTQWMSSFENHVAVISKGKD